MTIDVGHWYVVEYEMEMFTGVVTEIGIQNDFKVSVMVPAGANWKWPISKDEIFYPRDKIVAKLAMTETANNCGHFKFATEFWSYLENFLTFQSQMFLMLFY